MISHGVEDSAEGANDTQWHTHGVTLDSKNCVSKLNDDGTAKVNGMIKVANITATKLDKVNDGGIGHWASITLMKSVRTESSRL